MTDTLPKPPLRVSLVRILVRLAVVVAVVLLVRAILGALMPEEAAAALSGDGMKLGLLVVTLVAYAVLLAIPFVPGVEIGLTLLLFGGAAMAPFVYLATVAGLGAAYLAGRLLPYRWLHRVFLDLRMMRACRLIEEIEPLDGRARLDRLGARLPRWAAPVATHGRYLLLAALLVLPGNALIGGGGGICLVAGLSRLYRWPWALLTIALAVLPVPLGVWTMKLDVGAFF